MVIRFEVIQRAILALLLLNLLMLQGCSTTAPSNLGVQSDGALLPCPSSPNCVSSFAPRTDTSHFIAPYHVNAEGWGALRKIISNSPRMKVVTAGKDYMHVEATTLIFRFVDDLEFLYQPDKGLIQLRSASRVGYSDLGKNRRRLENMRNTLRQAGALSK